MTLVLLVLQLYIRCLNVDFNIKVPLTNDFLSNCEDGEPNN